MRIITVHVTRKKKYQQRKSHWLYIIFLKFEARLYEVEDNYVICSNANIELCNMIPMEQNSLSWC